MHRPLHSSTARARGPWIALLAFLVSWLAPLVHDAANEHVVCAEHGQVAHGGDEHGVLAPLAAHHAPADETAPVPGAQVAPGSPSDGHDEHCEHVVLRGPRRPPTLAVALPDAGFASSGRPVVAATAATWVEARLYRLAPKGSPPVA